MSRSLFLYCCCQRADFTIKPFAELVFGNIKVILGLQSHPELRRVPEEAREAQSSIGSEGALAKHDLIDTARVHADVNGKAVLAQVHRFDEFLQQHFTRMDGGKFVGHSCSF
jgi:hypothetical protein